MRAKTDEKRNAIIEAALAVFEEVGYQRASMAMISARLGGSKATLYGYFQSKELLFATAVTSALEEAGDETMAALASEGDIASVLRRYGRLYLDLVTRPEILAILRTVLSEGQNSTLGREVYALGPQRGITGLTEFLKARAAAGEIDLASPEVAAQHFKGLLEAGVTEPRLFGLTDIRDKREAVDTAVAAFMRIYGRS
ncbi:TetR/AcrR family transcriptional regulator [Pleomorphomonas carboxyditropha]|nr:TetR/AcrR family transcriptional regulator [Pleomorphomonas carboxyditropha]